MSATADIRSVLAALISTHNRLNMLLLGASHSITDISTDSKCELHLTHALSVQYLVHYFIKSNQIKSNQIKSNQIKSNQIKSNQIKSNQIKSNHSFIHSCI